MSTTPTTYNVAGHVCPDTGRLCMTVAEAYAREDAEDRRFYGYSIEAAESGLECWRQISEIDAESVPPGEKATYIVHWSGGGSALVTADMPTYMQRTKAEREPRYKLDLVNDETGLSASFAGVPGATALEAEGYVLTMMAAHTGWRVTGIDRA